MLGKVHEKNENGYAWKIKNYYKSANTKPASMKGFRRHQGYNSVQFNNKSVLCFPYFCSVHTNTIMQGVNLRAFRGRKASIYGRSRVWSENSIDLRDKTEQSLLSLSQIEIGTSKKKSRDHLCPGEPRRK